MLILVVTLFITSFPAIPEPCDYRPTRLTGDDVSKAAIGDVGAGGAVGTGVILVSTPLEWIHLSMLSEFTGALQYIAKTYNKQLCCVKEEQLDANRPEATTTRNNENCS